MAKDETRDLADAPGAVASVVSAVPESSMSAEIGTALVSVPDELSVEDVGLQVSKIQALMKSVMHKDEHYGVIPGTGDKPTLLKAGAEKLGFTFRLAPSYAITRGAMEGGHREYEVVCTLTHIQSGTIVGQGVGICTSMESKYRYRHSSRKCPACGGEYIIKGKDEYGGGWLCYRKKGGCGAKFPDGSQEIESQTTGRVENEDIADTYNTILKMSKKRAHVDAILTACAASDIFTQDIEDAAPDTTVTDRPSGKERKSTTGTYPAIMEVLNGRDEKGEPYFGPAEVVQLKGETDAILQAGDQSKLQEHLKKLSAMVAEKAAIRQHAGNAK